MQYIKAMVKKQKLCLAIDTASDTTSIALLGDKSISACMQMKSERGQGEALMGMIQDLLTRFKKTPKDLTHIAVTVGPGSFTGVRIGLATARGLGLALKIPVLGVDNFLATAYHMNQKLTVVLDSKRDDYFTQSFSSKGSALGQPKIKTAQELNQNQHLTVCGSGAEKLAQEIHCNVLSSTQGLALSAAQIALNEPSKTVAPHPFYLRDADVTI